MERGSILVRVSGTSRGCLIGEVRVVGRGGKDSKRVDQFRDDRHFKSNDIFTPACLLCHGRLRFSRRRKIERRRFAASQTDLSRVSALNQEATTAKQIPMETAPTMAPKVPIRMTRTGCFITGQYLIQ